MHGQRLAKGDTKVATCISCHGAHGVRLVSDAKSPVYALNVAATCTKCHADAERMKGYTLPGGLPIPTDQRAKYEKSVHHAAMVQQQRPLRADLQRLPRQPRRGAARASGPSPTCAAPATPSSRRKFALSTHSQIFERGCVECHSNHEIAKPSDALLGADKTALCITCHTEGDNGLKAATVDALAASRS